MKRYTLILLCFLAMNSLVGQDNNAPMNLSSTLISKSDNKLNIGGYGSVDFTKPFNTSERKNASLDVSRMIFSMAYRFSGKTQFFTEIEFEHVKELYVEQAFINHSFNEYFNLRAGLMLIPMGIINEYHEPTTFNGVSRPSVDKYIVPTTWREIGTGITGQIMDAGIKYQAYIFNGFNGYSGDKGNLSGSGFLRSGRQKGAKSFMSSPTFSSRIDYYGIMGLKLGLSVYSGKTQSSLFDGLKADDNAMAAAADSSVIGVNMIGLDARYSIKGLHLRGQYIYSLQSNVKEYNEFTGKDLGTKVNGYYAEISYNILRGSGSIHQLIPFVRYEHYDTHLEVSGGIQKNQAYSVNELVFGFGWKPVEGAVFKLDTRLRKSEADDSFSPYLNAGIGVWF